MSITQETQHEDRAGVRYSSEYPNFPEVSGTSFPLLSTVLAGFSVTIIVQLMVRPDPGEPLPAREVAALIAFLLAVLVLLASTTFSVNAQAHNYLPFLDLGDAAARRLRIDDLTDWLERLERRWYMFHVAALATFYAGVLLLLLGLNLVVWVYLGTGAAIIFLIAVVLDVGILHAVGVWVSRRNSPPRQDMA
jgi:hypothetical protein